MPTPASRQSALDAREPARRSREARWTTAQLATGAIAGAAMVAGVGGMAGFSYASARNNRPYWRDDVLEPYAGRPALAQGCNLTAPDIQAPRLDLAQAGAWARRDDCPPTDKWAPCIIGMNDVPQAPEPVLALLGQGVWRNCQVSACGGSNRFNNEPVTLSYTFSQWHDDAAAFFLAAHGRRLRQYSQASRALTRTVMNEISRYANLHFVEVDHPTPANIVYVMPDGPIDAGGYARIPTRNNTWASVSMQHPDAYRLHAHETAHAAGLLRDPYTEGAAGIRLPVAGWQDRTLDTLMASRAYVDDDHWKSSLRTGPLDLAVYAYTHGLSPALAGDSIHRVDANFGIAGIHDDDGVNTLAAIGRGDVHVDLRTNGEATCVGPAIARLSPTSTFQIADISQTAGGTLVGNGWANALIGSFGNDTFWVGSGHTHIYTRGGHDNIVLTARATHVTIEGFSPERTRLATRFHVQSLAIENHRTHVDAVINERLQLRFVGLSPVSKLKVVSISADTPAPSCDIETTRKTTSRSDPPSLSLLYASAGMSALAGSALCFLIFSRNSTNAWRR